MFCCSTSTYCVARLSWPTQQIHQKCQLLLGISTHCATIEKYTWPRYIRTLVFMIDQFWWRHGMYRSLTELIRKLVYTLHFQLFISIKANEMLKIRIMEINGDNKYLRLHCRWLSFGSSSILHVFFTWQFANVNKQYIADYTENQEGEEEREERGEREQQTFIWNCSNRFLICLRQYVVFMDFVGNTYQHFSAVRMNFDQSKQLLHLIIISNCP